MTLKWGIWQYTTIVVAEMPHLCDFADFLFYVTLQLYSSTK